MTTSRADAGRPLRLFSVAFGPGRLHFAFDSNMKRALIILLLSAFLANAEDGLFVMDTAKKKPKASIEGGELVMRVAARKVEAPKAKRIILFDSAGLSKGAYTVQVDLKESPDDGWMPIIVLGEEVLVDGVGISRSEHGGATLSFGTDDPNQATDFLARTAKIFGLDRESVLDTRKKKVQPDGPANDSQPIRSETNRTSSAAGSRR